MRARWVLLTSVVAAVGGCGGGGVADQLDGGWGDGTAAVDGTLPDGPMAADGTPGDGAATSDGRAPDAPPPDGPVVPAPPVCSAAPGGSTGPVQAPVVRGTLAASWDENWLASPAVVDLDGDGDMEIVLAGDHEHSSSTDNRGITVWVLNHDLTRPTGWLWPKDTGLPLRYGTIGDNIVTTSPSPSVADLDGLPGLEILVPAYDGKLHAFRADGTEAWAYTFATTGTPYTGASEALVVDLNGDGAPEIVFTTYSSGAPRTPDTPAHLVILDRDGAELHKVQLSGRGSMAAPAVADVDGDGQLELVVSLKDTLGGAQGGVQIWDLPGSAPNCVLWGTGRGGLLRQGYVPR